MASTTALVEATFDDPVRAEQAAAALRVFGRAHREVGTSPPCVVVRRQSGAVATHRLNRVTGRSGALGGLVIGAILLGLPAAGAASLTAWLFGVVLFSVLQLFGVIGSAQVNLLVIALTIGAAALAAILAGLVGAGLGALTGWLVGLVANAIWGHSGSQIATVYPRLDPGGAAVLTRTQVVGVPLVEAELSRLGGTPRHEMPRPAPPAAVAPSTEPAPTTEPAPEPTAEQPKPASRDRAADR